MPTPKVVPQRYRPKTSIEEITPHPRNVRRGVVEQIQTSLANVGWFGAVLVQESTNYILAGRHRWEAARREGHTTLPAFWLDVDDGQALKILLADNRMSDIAANDEEAVQTLLREIFEKDGTLEGTGYTKDDLDALVNDGLEDMAQTMRPPEQPITKAGDVWVLGPHCMAVGDARDGELWKAMMGGRKAALLWTDPPYGVEYESESLGGIQNDDLTGDKLIELLAPTLQLAAAHTRADAAFYIWHASTTRREFERAMLLAGLEEKQYLLWAKEAFVLGRSDFHWQHEPCYYAQKQGQKCRWFGGRTESTVWRVATREGSVVRLDVDKGVLLTTGAGTEIYIGKRPPKKSKNLRTLILRAGETLELAAQRGDTDTWHVDTARRAGYDHPTQKPLALAVRSITYSTKPGDLCVDAFAGAGTLLLAAEATARHAAVIEKDPRWADVICRRYQRMTGSWPVNKASGQARDFDEESKDAPATDEGPTP